MHLKTDTSANAHFSRVPTISHSRNAFSIAEKHVTTMQFDYLYPVFHKFIYPGDTISINHAMIARLQTQIKVLFDDLYLDAHAWFVPFRLLQTNWSRFQFNTQVSGPAEDNSSLTTPSIDLVALGASGFTAKSLYDYFGYPTAVDLTTSGQHINNYLARGYSLVWNQNYRDENLQNPVTVDLDDGPDAASDYVLLKRGKRHDKFTSCLTAPQKGTQPAIPISGLAPVLGIGKVNNLYPNAGSGFRVSDGSIDTFAQSMIIDPATATGQVAVEENPSNTGYPWIRADLNQITGGPSVNELRYSFAVQHLLEADARGGTRDVESIQHRWGVTVPDFRLQRAEYLGGTTFRFDGHIVPQTSETGTTPQATLKEFSQVQTGLDIHHSFVEHGVFMILVSARSNITYQQGLAKELSYQTRYDFYQPEFAHLGEVALLNKEIYLQGTTADDNPFGYQEYAYELRYGENRVTAEMRSNYATSLDSQHMADDYSSLPTLGAAWIQSNTDISRNIAVAAATADPIQLNMFAYGTMARTLPMYSVPGLMRL